jgi:hypothetical protein
MPDQHSENEYYDVYCPERIDDACQTKGQSQIGSDEAQTTLVPTSKDSRHTPAIQFLYARRSLRCNLADYRNAVMVH